MAELEVVVVAKSDKALKIMCEDSQVETWIPYSLISPNSEIDEDSDVEDNGIIIFPEWKAEEEGIL